MWKSTVRLLALSTGIALVHGSLSTPTLAGQAPPNFGGILGAILNSALTEQARREWKNSPLADYSCLEAHNLSADRLAAEGIGPNDPGSRNV